MVKLCDQLHYLSCYQGSSKKFWSGTKPCTSPGFFSYPGNMRNNTINVLPKFVASIMLMDEQEIAFFIPSAGLSLSWSTFLQTSYNSKHRYLQSVENINKNYLNITYLGPSSRTLKPIILSLDKTRGIVIVFFKLFYIFAKKHVV